MSHTERYSNIELLRVIAMSMIVIGHFLTHSIGRNALPYNIYLLLSPFCACGVNLFFLISGYFQINLSSRSLFQLISTLFLFGMTNVILVYLFVGEIIPQEIYSLVFFPISKSPYWFIQVYLLLVICSPLINTGINNMPILKYRKFILIFTLVTIYCCGIGHNISNSNGYTFLQGVYMYCLANYIRRDDELINRVSGKFFIVAFFLLTSLGAVGLYFTGILSFTSYNSFVNIFASLSLFIFISKIRFKSTIVNSISKAALGCYLLQDGLFGINYFYNSCHDFYMSHDFVINLVYFLSVFVGTWILSWILSQIFRLMSNTIFSKLIINLIR